MLPTRRDQQRPVTAARLLVEAVEVVQLRRLAVAARYRARVGCREPGVGGRAVVVPSEVQQRPDDECPRARSEPSGYSRCGGVGFNYCGPHDGHCSSLWVVECDSDGVRFDVTGTYSGTADVDFIHSYANDLWGVVCTAAIRCNILITENNYQGGLSTGSSRTHIADLLAYRNWRSFEVGGVNAGKDKIHVLINGTDTLIGIGRVMTDFGGTAVKAANFCGFGLLNIDGKSTGGRGLASLLQ